MQARSTRAHRPTLACLANGRSRFATNAGAIGHGKHGPNAPSDNPRVARCWNGPWLCPWSAPLRCAQHCAKKHPRSASVRLHRSMCRCWPTSMKLASDSRVTHSRIIGAIRKSHLRACLSGAHSVSSCIVDCGASPHPY